MIFAKLKVVHPIPLSHSSPTRTLPCPSFSQICSSYLDGIKQKLTKLKHMAKPDRVASNGSEASGRISMSWRFMFHHYYDSIYHFLLFGIRGVCCMPTSIWTHHEGCMPGSGHLLTACERLPKLGFHCSGGIGWFMYCALTNFRRRVGARQGR